MKKCVVIYNPHSGKHLKKDFMDKFIGILMDNNYDPEVITSKYHGHITKIVTDIEIADLVISIGGDGTFNEAMTGNLKREKRLLLAHIPVGTTNDVGVMFGYGKNPISNLKLLLEGKTVKMDICTINDKPFVYVAGFGKFMNVPYETNRKTKKKLGYLAYILGIVKEITTRTRMFDITYMIDNEEYNGLYSFMLVGNATRIGGINNVFYDVKLDDGKFEVLLCNLRMKKDIVKTLYYLRKTSIAKVPGFYFHKTDNLKIRFNESDNIPWCVDGEKLESDNNEFSIKVVKDIEIMIPEKNIEKLFEK